MRYGLIGEKLGHSFSKIIHEQLADYTYELIPLEKTAVDDFLSRKEFRAINVTIPYKETVLPYLDEIEENAAKIGAINTIVNDNGHLKGYNTDYLGFQYMLRCHNIDVSGKKVLILGHGGASKAIQAAVAAMGASEIYFVYYKSNPETISYETAQSEHADAAVIINATPVGMFPAADVTPIDLAPFTKLEAVVDAIYNPLRPRLIVEAQQKGITAVGGLEMLVAQAKFAVEIFLDTTLSDEKINEIHQNLMIERSNLVLVGMSGSGKTTIGKAVAKLLHKTFVDTDEEILSRIQMPISDYFAQYGEKAFRDLEAEIISSLSVQNGLVIATGGGAVLREENIRRLKQNGRILWLKRDISSLETGNGRPLAPDAQAAAKLYETRLPIYQKTAETVVENDASVDEIAEKAAAAFTKLLRS